LFHGLEKIENVVENQMPGYVVDASVIAKWILPGEIYEDNALRLKTDHTNEVAQLHAPVLLRYELGSVLRKASNKARISSESVEEAIKIFALFRINFHDQGWEEMGAVYKISNDLKLTIYDASYLRLSSELALPFLTADAEIVKAAKQRYRVIDLKDY
jgi:predicted nucleic acid-binding protein